MFAEFRNGLAGSGVTPEQFDDLLAWWQAGRGEAEGLPAFLVRQGVLNQAGANTLTAALRGTVPVRSAAPLLATALQARRPAGSTAKPLGPGGQFGPYRIFDQIGRGPRATVFTAEDTRTGHTLALKVFNRPGAKTMDPRSAGELAPQAGLGHPNCLPILEAGFEAGVPYLAMPYARGGSAHDVLGRRGSMPPAQAARVCRLAAQGLAAAHAAGLPHSNLKLTNILLGEGGEVWLSDFARRPPGTAASPTVFTADLRAFAVIIARLVTNQAVPDLPVAGSLPRILAGVPSPFGAVVSALVADPPAAPCASAAHLAGELANAEATVVATTTAALTSPVASPAAPVGAEPQPLPVGPPPQQGSARIGSTLGKCLLTARIGQGGAGVVYRAEHQTLHIDVAVKVLHADSADPTVRKGLRKEARLLARLNHPNVVRLWDFDESSVPPYLVMEFVDGVTLADLIAVEGCVPAERALGLIEQVAQALAAAQTLGIIHRDVKPANVLVAPDGTAKLTDLGLALMINSRLSSLARPHVAGLAGTIAYLAPEQAVGSPNADHRADIYSLGATFYHLVAGRVPFPALTVMDVLRKHATEPPPPPHVVAPQVPKVLSPTILRMLSKDPRDRPQSYQVLLAEFRSLRDALESSRLMKTDAEIELPEELTGRPPPEPRPTGWLGRLFGRRPRD